MTPTLNKIYPGDCLDTMRTWPDAFVHCVVTSPPYWGLRDYKTPPRVWGGEEWTVSAVSKDGRLQLKKELKGRTMYAGSISRHGQGLKFVRGNYTA